MLCFLTPPYTHNSHTINGEKWGIVAIPIILHLTNNSIRLTISFSTLISNLIMSYTRIRSFLAWLTNKWCGNLFHFPLFFHKTCTSRTVDNLLFHAFSLMAIVIMATTFAGRDAGGKILPVAWYWDGLFYLNILHFIYCCIVIQYNTYISELNGTLDRLKNHE